MFTKFYFLLILSIFISQSMLNSKNTSKIISHSIRLKPHQDIKQSLMDYVLKHKINAACMLTCVGSAEQLSLRYANLPSGDTLIGKFEIVSLVGTLGANSGCHLHISISDSTGKTIGGHLQNGTLVYTTAEIVIAELVDVNYKRIIDSTYGYKELEIEGKK
jgi:uncharacterized protein